MKNVYIIDDDPVLQKIMYRMIKNFNSSIEIISYLDGQEAIDGMSKVEKMPDLIFLDINMPKMDAWQFIEAYNEENFARVPLYILSSSIDQRDIDRANALPLVKMYLIKPMKKQDLHDLCEVELNLTS